MYNMCIFIDLSTLYMPFTYMTICSLLSQCNVVADPSFVAVSPGPSGEQLSLDPPSLAPPSPVATSCLP